VQEAACGVRHAAAQLQVVRELWPAQIEEAVRQPQLLACWLARGVSKGPCMESLCGSQPDSPSRARTRRTVRMAARWRR
jgi:hypothetical protein